MVKNNITGTIHVTVSANKLYLALTLMMVKRVLILVIAACFFLENIVVYLVIKNNAAYYLAGSDENDTAENGENLKKDKQEDYKISASYKYFFLSDALQNNFHVFEEQTYSGYCPPINLPPPDIA